MTEGEQPFKLESFIAELTEPGYSEGHQADLNKGDDPAYVLDREINRRIGKLTNTSFKMELKGGDPGLIRELKTQGTEALLEKFPEAKEKILTALKENGGFGEVLQNYEAGDKKVGPVR